jgi:Uncharacterized protein conserved in bacteria (DUF2066)
MGITIRKALFAMILAIFAISKAWAAGPVETSVFAVQGVEVDVTDVDAATAKNKAIVDVQLKAFHQLIDQYGNADMVEKTVATEPKEIMEYLKSLSIEEERFSPGRYGGKFTVRFLPSKMGRLFADYGIKLQTDQAPATLVIPVWKENGTIKLWEENQWRAAWKVLAAAQGSVPIIVALGDAEDERTLTATDVVANDPLKLEAMRRRYDVASVLLAMAEPEGASDLKVKIEGASPIGNVRIDKIYASDDGTQAGASRVAAQRFVEVMTKKYTADALAIAAKKGRIANAITVAVPFTSPSQWNGIRSRILATPGVKAVDVTSLDADGAVISLRYAGELADITASFQTAGLRMSQSGGSWIIEAL